MILLLLPPDIAVHLLTSLSAPEMVMQKSTYKEGEEQKLELNETEMETMKLLTEKSMWKERYLTQEDVGELQKTLRSHFNEEIVAQTIKNFEERNV